MFGSKKRIRIEFFDVETGQMIGFDEKRPKQIPPTFRFDTLVQIGGKTWKLVEAEPFERKKFLKSGLLTIKLRLEDDQESEQLPPIPAEEKLYRSASRPGEFPEFGGSRKGKILEMGAWEWRGVELISQRFRSEIGREIGQIEDLKKQAGTEQNGIRMFTRQHLRDLPADSVDLDTLSVKVMVKSWFPFANAYDGVRFMTDDKVAKNAFAYHMPAGLTIYGLSVGTQITCLGLIPPEEKHQLIAMQDLARLVEFMEAHSLVLVDWNKLKFLEPALPAISDYFEVEASLSAPPQSPPPPLEDAAMEAVEKEEDDAGVTTAAEAEKTEQVSTESEESLLFTANSFPKPPILPSQLETDDLEMRIDHSLEIDSAGEEE